MKEIEISTTQNVNIEYKLATLRERILAYFIDMLAMGGVIVVLLIIFLIGAWGGENAMNNFTIIVIAPVFFFYSLLFETFNGGRSLGKMALQIRVVKISGQRISLNDYLTRWVFRMIDIYFTLGSVASFLISSSRKHQRLGDILANTTVIRYKPDYTFNLKSIVNRNHGVNFEPKYSDVRKFREEEMLLVKTVLERYRKFPNTAHQEALNMLVVKVQEQLGIKERPANKVAFLESVLKEYIILTR